MSGYSRCGDGRRVNLPRYGLLAAGLFGGSLAISAPALADTGRADLLSVNHPAIVVTSNGKNYVGVDPGAPNIEGQIHVAVDAEITGRVKSFEAWPTMYLSLGLGDFDVTEDFKGTGMSYSKSYSSPRPKKVSESFFFSIPRARYQNYMVRVCQFHADGLRADGHSDSEIFGVDRPIQVNIDADLIYDTNGAKRVNPPPTQVSDVWPIDVLCKGLPPRVPAPVANDPARNTPVVEQATLSISGKGSLRGNTACFLNLSGVIRSKDPNTHVKFRYRSDDGRESDLKTVVTDHSATAMFSHEYPLSAGGTRSGKIRIVGEGPDFTSGWADYSVNCGSPAQGFAADTITPPTLTLNTGVKGEKMVKGFACPQKLGLDGRIQAVDAFDDGRAIFSAAQQGGIEPTSQVFEQNVAVVAGQKLAVGFEPAINWANVPSLAGSPPHQTMKVVFQVARTGGVIASTQRNVVLSCRKIAQTGVGSGPMGEGSPARPDPAQGQAGAPAQGVMSQPAALAIAAPNGLVRRGEIRLEGAQTNATYSLRFFRRDAGGITLVTSAQLPKQMKGAAASFPLRALTGGRDWRLEVCPAGRSGAACKTADFRIAALAG